MKILSLQAALVLTFFGACLHSETATPAKPNIVFILADDYGYGEVGCNGADNYKTPNLDALAKGGIRFNHFYTSPLCGPSRSQILTGRYPFRTGAIGQDECANLARTGEKPEVMIPTVLRKAGYNSAMIGKWGQLMSSGNPAQWGFNLDMHFKASGIYWNKTTAKKLSLDGEVRGDPNTYEVNTLVKAADGKPSTGPQGYVINSKTLNLGDTEYMPDVMHKQAVEFLEKNKDNPFFLYYSMSHVHAQILPTPDSEPAKEGQDKAARYAQVYTDNVVYMDKLIGKLVAELDRLKLSSNTIIFFMGDNGTAKANAPRATIGGKRLVGQKGDMEEGGGLVPFIISWPGVTAGGKLNTNFTDSSDLLTTFADLAGVPLPEKFYDGKSLVAQIKGDEKSARNFAFCQLGPKWYVRENNWRLSQTLKENGDVKSELFDMKEAPFKEVLVAEDSTDPEAMAARKRLTTALAELNPAGGAKADPNASGRSGKKDSKKIKKDAKVEKPAA